MQYNSNARLVRRPGPIAGVCAGIAERYNIDPVIVRILFLLTLAPGGIPGIVLYTILWLIMPKGY